MSTPFNSIGEQPLYNKIEMKVHRQSGVRGKDLPAFQGHASCGLCGGNPNPTAL